MLERLCLTFTNPDHEIALEQTDAAQAPLTAPPVLQPHTMSVLRDAFVCDEARLQDLAAKGVSVGRV